MNTPERLPRAEDVYADFRRRRDGGEDISIESIRAEHPELANALEVLHLAHEVEDGDASHARRSEDGDDTFEALVQDALGDGSNDTGSDTAAAPGAAQRYTIRRELARGGMGVIYEVWDEQLGRPLAMKVLGPSSDSGVGSPQPTTRARFLDEAQVTGRLDHPGIVPVHELGVDPRGRPFFTMALVDGRDLKTIFELDRQGNEDWTETRLVGVLGQVCRALAYAHSKGIIHRDLKPANVMVGRFGEVYVMDWGLAKVRNQPDRRDLRVDRTASRPASDARGPVCGDDSPLVTGDGTVLGTPAFMAPEQARGRLDEIDELSDLYSVGAILYALLTGSPPYARPGENPSSHDVLAAVIAGPPTPVHELAGGAAPELVAICEKAMARDKPDRYASLNELAEDLQAYLENRVVRAHRTGVAVEFRKWVSRNRGTAAAVAVAALLSLVGLAAIIVLQELSRQEIVGERDAKVTALEGQEKALRRAEGLRLAAEARAVVDVDPGLALTLAIEGARRSTGVLSRSALLEALAVNREEHVLPAGWEVTDARFTPDGKLAVTVSTDGKLRVWDADSGEEVLRLCGHRSGLNALAVSADGRLFASAGWDATVRLWDATSGKQLFALEGGPEVIDDVAFDAPGARVATACRDGIGRVFSTATGELLFPLVGHDNAVVHCAFSPDGRRVATSSDDGTVRLWDASNGELLHVLAGHTDRILYSIFSPDGRRIVTAAGDGTARLWSTSAGELLQVLGGHDGVVSMAVFSPDGRSIVTASTDRTVRVRDAASGSERLRLVGHDDQVNTVFFDSRGDRLLTASHDGTARVWDARNGRELICLRGHTSWLYLARFSPDGSRVITASKDFTARVWDVSMERAPPALPRTLADRFRTVSANGRYAISHGRGKEAEVQDATTGETLVVLQGHDEGIVDAAFSPDGERAMTGSLDRTARIWDVSSGRELTVLRGHGDSVECVAFSNDGARVATGSKDLTVRVWEATSGRELAVLPGHRDWLYDVVFSPDDTKLVAIGTGPIARLWEVESARHLHDLRHIRQLYFAAFSPDGRRVLTVSTKSTIRVWDASSGERISGLGDFDSEVAGASFDADGSRLATVHRDGAVRVWDLPSAELLARIRSSHERFLAAVLSAGGDRLDLVVASGLRRSLPLDPLPTALTRGGRPLSPEEQVRFEVGTDEERTETHLRWHLDRIRRAIELGRRQATADPSNLSARHHHSGIVYRELFEMTHDLRLAEFVGRHRPRRRRDVVDSLEQAMRFLEETLRLPDASTSTRRQIERVWRELRPAVLSYAAADAALADRDRHADPSAPPRNDAEVVDAARNAALGLAAADGAERALRYLEGRRLQRAARYAEAASVFRDLVALDPGDVLPACRLVECARAAGASDEAHQVLIRTVENASAGAVDDVQTLKNAAYRILLSPGEEVESYVRAWIWTRRALEIASVDLGISGRIGIAQYRLELYEDALGTLQTIDLLRRSTRKAHPREAAFLAMIHHRLGNLEAARHQLKVLRDRVRDRVPGPDSAPYALEAESVVGPLPGD